MYLSVVFQWDASLVISWRFSLSVPLKCSKQHTSLHSITTQKTTVDVCMGVNT